MTQAGAALLKVDAETQRRVVRVFDHRAVADACKRVGQAKSAVDPRLRDVADAFLRLREAREKADYDLGTVLGWSEASELVVLASRGCGSFVQVQALPETIDFLLDFLFQNRLRRG